MERLRSLPLRSTASDFHFQALFSLFSVSLRRSVESFKFWRSRFPRSPAWSFRPGRGEPRSARGTKGKKPSRGRRRPLRRRPQPGTPWPMTASRQPGPMKSASHDRRKNFLERCLRVRAAVFRRQPKRRLHLQSLGSSSLSHFGRQCQGSSQ